MFSLNRARVWRAVAVVAVVFGPLAALGSAAPVAGAAGDAAALSDVLVSDSLQGYAERRSDNPLGELYSRPIDAAGVSGDADLDAETTGTLVRGYVRVWADRVEDEFMVGTVTEYDGAAAAQACVRVATHPVKTKISGLAPIEDLDDAFLAQFTTADGQEGDSVTFSRGELCFHFMRFAANGTDRRAELDQLARRQLARVDSFGPNRGEGEAMGTMATVGVAGMVAIGGGAALVVALRKNRRPSVPPPSPGGKYPRP